MPIHLTRSVKTLLIGCVVAFLIQQTGDQFFGTHLLGWFGLVPSAFIQYHRYWQLFTYSFLHGDVMHLFFNLMMLAFIGSDLEVTWGRSRFLRYYFFCATSSGAIYLLFQLLLRGWASTAPLVGASGAIYGLLMAYGILFGERVLLFMMFFPMKAKHFIWVLALVQLMTTIYSPGGAWASLAHLSGMATGLVYLWVQAKIRISHRSNKNKLFSSKNKKKRSRHLKLIVNNQKDFDSSNDDSENNPKTWH
jgi:membrane associated rhomboid family serine protease